MVMFLRLCVGTIAPFFAMAAVGLALADQSVTPSLPAIFNGHDLAGWKVIGAPY